MVVRRWMSLGPTDANLKRGILRHALRFAIAASVHLWWTWADSRAGYGLPSHNRLSDLVERIAQIAEQSILDSNGRREQRNGEVV
jgi:hypothetical protein